MINLTSLLLQFYKEDHESALLMESHFVELNELKIDEYNSYQYEEGHNSDLNIPNITWSFQDRCNNVIVAAYLPNVKEFKTGYKVEGVTSLVFQPEKLTDRKVVPCPDDKKLSTIYKILVQEVIPNYLLNKRPNRLSFNPVSSSRKRLADILMKKAGVLFPQLIHKDNYLVYK